MASLMSDFASSVGVDSDAGAGGAGITGSTGSMGAACG